MANYFDFINGKIITAENLSPRQQKAITVLLEETEKRSRRGLELIQGDGFNTNNQIIALGTNEKHPMYPAEISALLKKNAIKAEGFQIISVASPKPSVVVHGADDRGLLYGIGRLLRKAKISPGSFLLPENLNVIDSPRYPMRGHQMGYRPKTNAYDAWTEEIFDQYIRDLALFGANSIEILPPNTDDDVTGPHIKKDPLEMMIRLSEIIDSYGLDVWIWLPNMGKDYKSAEGIRAELAEREVLFSKLKRIDAVFIPGGDPGDLDSDELFIWSEKVAALLHKYHAGAGLWISPQAFAPTDSWLDTFYAHVNKEPEWLAGIVHGPWIKTKIADMRKKISAKYPLRNYPDITHSIYSEYPPFDWDLAFAKSLERECVNPRPLEEKHIHNLYKDYFVGSISYSEGINDDVNKFVWSDQDWNPDIPVVETLRDYARLFISPDCADDIAQGILALERNFAYPVAVNKEINTSLRQWQELERDMPFVAMQNYRFQMCLLRANYDAYIKRRLAHETELELEAMELLENTGPRFLRRDIKSAWDILDRARTKPVGQKLREKCVTLADLLFVNIYHQLTVERHKAIHWIRGAFMDSIDTPLNEIRYLTNRFEKILEIKDPDAAFIVLRDEVLNRTNPGPGGFYDSMGDLESWHRFPDRIEWRDDPGNMENIFRGFPIWANMLDDNKDQMKGIPLAWQKSASVLYGTPMKVRYENLDPEAEYSLTIKYLARNAGLLAKTVSLTANGEKLEWDTSKMERSHPLVKFELPRRITEKGYLTLVWSAGSGEPETAVSEIFLVKRK